MRLRYAWIDVPVFVVAVLLLIPLLAHLAEILFRSLAAPGS